MRCMWKKSLPLVFISHRLWGTAGTGIFTVGSSNPTRATYTFTTGNNAFYFLNSWLWRRDWCVIFPLLNGFWFENHPGVPFPDCLILINVYRTGILHRLFVSPKQESQKVVFHELLIFPKWSCLTTVIFKKFIIYRQKVFQKRHSQNELLIGVKQPYKPSKFTLSHVLLIFLFGRPISS